MVEKKKKEMFSYQLSVPPPFDASKEEEEGKQKESRQPLPHSSTEESKPVPKLSSSSNQRNSANHEKWVGGHIY